MKSKSDHISDVHTRLWPLTHVAPACCSRAYARIQEPLDRLLQRVKDEIHWEMRGK